MPMNPEFLPEFALLIAGVILGGVAVHFLAARRWLRALALLGAGVALMALAFASGRSDRLHGTSARLQNMKPRGLVPADSTDSPGGVAETPSSVSLVLGDVDVRVAASDRYVLSLDDAPFLTIDSLASGILVSCDVAGSTEVSPGASRLAATISRNVVTYCAGGVETTVPDRHTIAVRERGVNVLRVRYSKPRRIEVAGRFYVPGDPEPAIIAFADGIEWRGGVVPSGTSVDLRAQGEGTVRFERSGLIRVEP